MSKDLYHMVADGVMEIGPLKTRMHEILGVEPYERFEVKGRDGEFMLDAEGAVRFGKNMEMSAYSQFTAVLINHPENIIRKPRLTAEQKYALEAIYKVFGMRWLVYDAKIDIAYASKMKPERHKENELWMVPGPKMDLWVSSTLVNLASSTEPLDIAQALRDAGA